MWLGPVMDEMNDDGWKSKSSYGEKKKTTCVYVG